MTRTPLQTGIWGESIASKFLENLGYSILEKNVRTPYGEIDIIASQTKNTNLIGEDNTLVFVEVKTRRSSLFGFPEDSITKQKRSHLLAAIQSYLQEHSEIGSNWRVDVIAIRKKSSDDDPEIIHFVNAITDEDFE